MDAHAVRREEADVSGIPLLTDTGAVIVTHDRAELARDCARRIREEVDPSLIIAVVNDPDNASADALEWLAANVGVVVLNERRRGYGANLNEGVRQLRGRCRYYLLSNDDVLPERGAIRALRDVPVSDSATAVVGPRLVDLGGRRQQSAYRYPTVVTEVASSLILPARLQRWVWRRFVLPRRDRFGSPASDVWLVGAALVVRASMFDEIDGFDEHFFLYSEETDLLFRMKQRGWLTRRCEGIAAVHLGGESTTDRRYRRMMGVSRQKYIRKHWSRRQRIVLRALLAPTYFWNSIYVVVRILLQPRSCREKLSFWAVHWDKRPHSAARPREGGGSS